MVTYKEKTVFLDFLFKKAKIESAYIAPMWQWVLTQAQELTPLRFEKESQTKEDRIEKFEPIAFVMSYVFWVLRKEPELNADAQSLYDYMFDQFEIAMREQGVSDVRVGKEVRKFSSAFDGRRASYAEAFEEKSLKNLQKSLLHNESWSNEELEKLCKWYEKGQEETIIAIAKENK